MPLTLAVAALAASAASGPLGERIDLPGRVRGIVLGLHDTDPRRSYARDVAEIAGTGANAVSLVPTLRMRDVASGEVEDGPASLAQLAEAARVACQLGLAVLVAPIVRLDRTAEGEWRGTIRPPDWGAWFGSYSRRLLAVAEVAERERAAALLVGSELCSSEFQEERWRALVTRVRATFSGELGYQTNWDHRQTPRFLDALDLLATNAYFEVGRDLARPTVAALERAWRPYREELLAWAEGLNRPLLITEVGYPSVATGVRAPWDHAGSAPADPEVQRLAYEALFRVWDRAPRTRGYFLYDWWGEGGPADRGYTPRGKPAEAVLRRNFRAARARR